MFGSYMMIYVTYMTAFLWYRGICYRFDFCLGTDLGFGITVCLLCTIITCFFSLNLPFQRERAKTPCCTILPFISQAEDARSKPQDVSPQDFHSIDPHMGWDAAKFGCTSIIHAGRTWPGGPGTALARRMSCITHMVIQQDSSLAPTPWWNSLTIRIEQSSDRGSQLQIPTGKYWSLQLMCP